MEKVKDTAFTAARAAGRILKECFGAVERIDYKSAFNLVTDVDAKSEQEIIRIIKENFPDHNILGEESGTHAASSKKRWLIDPLDGTTNYAHAYPFFCVSIAFEDDGELLLGIVFNPVSGELFFAEKGRGAFLGEQQVKVSKVGELSASLLATGFPPDTLNTANNNIAEFAHLTSQCHGVRRDGSAALDLSFVACGRLDGFWEYKLAPWDLGAGTLIVEEAGGKVTSLSGNRFDITSGHVLATNGLIHDSVVDCLTRVQADRASRITS